MYWSQNSDLNGQGVKMFILWSQYSAGVSLPTPLLSPAMWIQLGIDVCSPSNKTIPFLGNPPC